MNSVSVVLAFALVATVSAHSLATSYVKRQDGISHHDYHHEPLLIHQPVVYAHHAAPIEHGWGAVASSYAPDYHQEYHSYPKYKFEYGVNDPHTGDHKSQYEHRDGDKVVGEYTLDEADGTKRVVQYHDDGHGFNAVVKKIGHAHHPQVYHQQPYHHDSYSHETYHHEPLHHVQPYHHGYASSYNQLYVPEYHH